jgi:hypothetical protein
LRLEPTDSIEIKIRPSSFHISLLLGLIPRAAFFAISPTATLAAAEPLIRQKYAVGYLDLEFCLWDLRSDESEVIPKSSVIGDLDLSNRKLILRPVEDIEIPISEVAVPEKEKTDRQNLLEVVQLTCGEVQQNAVINYGFLCEQQHEELQILLPLGAKVGDARRKIAQRYDRPQEQVTLQYMGKTLRDQFAIDGLRLGKSKIIVLLQDTSM